MNSFFDTFQNHIFCDRKNQKQLQSFLMHTYFPPCAPSALDAFSTIYAAFEGPLTGVSSLSVDTLPCYAFLFVYTGNASLLYDGNDYALTKGCLAFMDVSKGYTLSVENGMNIDYLILFINGSLCPTYFDIFSKEQTILSFPPENASIQNRLKTLLSLAQTTDEDDAYFLISNKLLTDLITSTILEHNTNPVIKTVVPNHVIAATTYINNHFTENISLDLLEKVVHVSKYTLSHDFKKYMNTSVMDYVSMRRIEQAKHLLATTNFSVLEISYQLCFSSDAHFVSAFKKRTGTTPLQYRKQHNARSFQCQ